TRSASPTRCRRRARARSCGGCCATSPPASRRRGTRRRWRTSACWRNCGRTRSNPIPPLSPRGERGTRGLRESPMFEILNRLSGEQVVVLALILAGAVVLVALIVVGFWSSLHAAKLQAALKRDMLERGMSVEDILRLTESNLLLRQEQIAAD